MKAHRSGFVGLLVGVTLLVACEGDPPPPIVVPITVDIVPDTATLTPTAPGNTRQFTAVLQNTPNQAVMWRSSVTGVATVSETGLVTAVAPGTTQIIAISVEDSTRRAAAQVNVTSLSGPSLIITGVTRSGTNIPVDRNNVVGEVDVGVDLQAQGGSIRVEFLLGDELLDGTGGRPNCTQTVTGPAGQRTLLKCTINTSAFVATTGAPVFSNGARALTVRATQTSNNATSTASFQVTFNNPNFISATLSFLEPGTTNARQCLNAGPNARSLGGAGSLWCSGDVRVSLTPVNFGGASSAIVTASVALRTSGQGVSGGPDCLSGGDAASDPTIAPVDRTPTATGDFPGCAPATTILTDGNAADGLSFVFAAENIEDIVTFTVNSGTAGNTSGPTCINPAAVGNPLGVCGTGATGGSAPNVAFFADPVRIDNLAPRVTLFDLTPEGCQTSNCFLDEDFTFTTRADFYVAVDYGVDSQNASTIFQAGPTVDSLTTVISTAQLDNTTTSTALLLRVSARDAFGNGREVFPTANNLVVTTDASAALRFGVDKSTPAMRTRRLPD
jgi:hypothetical protein